MKVRFIAKSTIIIFQLIGFLQSFDIKINSIQQSYNPTNPNSDKKTPQLLWNFASFCLLINKMSEEEKIYYIAFGQIQGIGAANAKQFQNVY